MRIGNRHGFSIIELLMVLLIFGVVMAGLYSAYRVQARQGIQQYKLAESEMEFEIAKSIIERDVLMTGYGIADIYCDTPTADTINCPVSGLKCYGFCLPVPIRGSNGTPDTLTLMGTGLGMGARATGGWSYTENTAPATTGDYKDWTTSYPASVETDAREEPRTAERVVYIEPNVKRLFVAGGNNTGTGGTNKSWVFAYPPAGDANENPPLSEPYVLVFGLYKNKTGNDEDLKTEFPYYRVTYHLSTSGTGLKNCASSTENLLRLETRQVSPASPGQPILNCVRDFQVAFGLDTDQTGDIDCWDNGGTVAAGYTNDTLKTRLKQVKMYALVQEGKRDDEYVYKNPDPAYAATPNKVRVGDSLLNWCGGAGGVGNVVTLTADERKYRWRVVSWSIVPRNMQ